MICEKCRTENHYDATYCRNCGFRLKELNRDSNISYSAYGLFFLILIVDFILFFSDSDYYFLDYQDFFIADSVFIVLVVSFSLFSFSSLKKLFSFKALKTSLMLKIIAVLPFIAIPIAFLINEYNLSFLGYKENLYWYFIDSPMPVPFAILSICIVPAIFEELAFRGYIFEKLLENNSLKSTIFISSIMFTLVHLSIVSALWIFPFALFLGYLRAKYRNLWYCIITHFFYNFSVLMYEIYLTEYSMLG